MFNVWEPKFEDKTYFKDTTASYFKNRLYNIKVHTSTAFVA